MLDCTRPVLVVCGNLGCSLENQDAPEPSLNELRHYGWFGIFWGTTSKCRFCWFCWNKEVPILVKVSDKFYSDLVNFLVESSSAGSCFSDIVAILVVGTAARLAKFNLRPFKSLSIGTVACLLIPGCTLGSVISGDSCKGDLWGASELLSALSMNWIY